MAYVLILVYLTTGGASGRTLAEPIVREFSSAATCNKALEAASELAVSGGYRVQGTCVEA